MTTHKLEIVGASGRCLLRTIGETARRSLPLLRGVLCATLLLVGTASAQTMGQTRSDPAADRDMAERYLRAAQAGDDVAQFCLGALYAAGVGRTQSDTEAFQWIERAAQRGNTQAMLVAGGLTALGKGTPKDYVGSYKWAFLVAEGSQAADMKNSGRQLITMLEPRMTADQIRRAKSEAYQFKAVGTQVAAPARISTTAPTPSLQSPRPPASTAAVEPQAPASSTAPPQPAASATPAPALPLAAVEARKHLNKENVDRLIKNVPPTYRKRFGL